MLEPHAGRGERARQGVVVAADEAVALIADRHDKRQQRQADEQAHKHVAGGEHSAHKREQQNGNRDHDEQEARAAARMEPGHAAAVFDGQRQLRLIAADGLMLRAVVGEHALHILHP